MREAIAAWIIGGITIGAFFAGVEPAHVGKRFSVDAIWAWPVIIGYEAVRRYNQEARP